MRRPDVSEIVIATCAFPGTYDIGKSLELHLSYIEEAAVAGAAIVVFPETSLQGYPNCSNFSSIEGVLNEVQRVAETVPDGPAVRRLIAAAMKHQIHVVFGLIEAGTQPGILYNTLVLAGPQGYIGSYRKVHLGIGEQLVFRPGDRWPVFDTPLGRIGMLICYDKCWPEACRELTLSGAELLVMGTAWLAMPGHGEGEDNLYVQWYNLFDRVRAVENYRWFISSNFVGELGGETFIGFSQIVDPLGCIVASSGLDRVGLVTAKIDIRAGLARTTAIRGGPRLIRDRRAETYKVLNGSLPILVDG
ncbi:carbon-nitrogen hydrolase family protein [Mesorhizobium sp. SARCC-RB16n]|uniref:carbon-nitrogen hydrolase family protein n=1 Tax=Mesorhizobium sp. SARCC-RB16n TaxID=2116687 RepID=UPI00122F67DE|nr:carbon-nitrogen hydrolase family protein [Mesorhizobium sp. SARCC-RB16n]KAA3448191.1 carbon-nitrogen hydrolase family protein [Mesorhizobium sp. SARCC-RB16n]